MGISNTVMKTAGTADLKLYTDAHETLHTLHVLEKNFEMQQDAILGKEFFWNKGKA